MLKQMAILTLTITCNKIITIIQITIISIIIIIRIIITIIIIIIIIIIYTNVPNYDKNNIQTEM